MNQTLLKRTLEGETKSWHILNKCQNFEAKVFVHGHPTFVLSNFVKFAIETDAFSILTDPPEDIIFDIGSQNVQDFLHHLYVILAKWCRFSSTLWYIV